MILRRLIVDSGVWFAMFARRDGHADKVGDKIQLLGKAGTLVVPWPTMYETLCTRFVKDYEGLDKFMEYIDRPNVEMFDSTPYDDAASEMATQSALLRRRPLSMVDCLIRLIIEDPGAEIDALLTLNIADFHDSCEKSNVLLL